MKKQRRKEILIVDDDKDLCTILSMNLKHIAPIHKVHSLDGAFRYLEENEPAVILLDNSLPDGYGIKHVKKIKELTREVKIIVITSDTEHSLQEESLSEGATHFMCKPFSASAFRNVVQQMLGA